MKGHVDAESLALYAEGQLSRRRAAQVRAHLPGCPECARTAAALTEVTAQLRHVPVPPVPAAVAARLDAALSAESAHRAAAPAPRPPRRNPRWSPNALRALAATGAALVVAGGIGYALSQTGSPGTSSSASGASSPARSAERSPAHRPTIGAMPNVPPGSNAIRPNTPGGTRYAQSGTDYQPGTLAAQARQKLAEPGLLGPGRAITAGVAHCVSHTAHGRPVRLVDLARYQNHPAIVIVLGNPGTVTAASYSCRTLKTAPLPVTSPPGAG